MFLVHTHSQQGDPVQFFFYLVNSSKQGIPKQKPAPQDSEDDDSDYAEEVIAERQELGEKIIKKIEKWSVIFFFLAFVIFVTVYWIVLMNKMQSIQAPPQDCKTSDAKWQ